LETHKDSFLGEKAEFDAIIMANRVAEVRNALKREHGSDAPIEWLS
jgi:hypothetical protein